MLYALLYEKVGPSNITKVHDQPMLHVSSMYPWNFQICMTQLTMLVVKVSLRVFLRFCRNSEEFATNFFNYSGTTCMCAHMCMCDKYIHILIYELLSLPPVVS